MKTKNYRELFIRKHYPEFKKTGATAGLVLRLSRLRKGLAQGELANAVGVYQSHISQMERSKRVIGKKMARRLAAELKISYRVFLG